MTAPIGSPTIPGQTPKPKPTDLGKDEFLSLLVTQLKNQDPLNPLKSDEFAAQLAQFTTVEQLTKLNDAVAAQTTQQALNTHLSMTSLGASLIGKHIYAESNQIALSSATPTKLRVDVGGTGGIGTLMIKDAGGRVVATKELGRLDAGSRTVTPPTGVPDGSYTYEVKVKGADDKDVPVTTYTSGVVDGVLFQDGQIVLRMGSIQVPLDKLSEIMP